MFLLFFLSYIKLTKTFSAKYYQDNKDKLQKRLVKDIKVFSTKKTKKGTMRPSCHR